MSESESPEGEEEEEEEEGEEMISPLIVTKSHRVSGASTQLIPELRERISDLVEEEVVVGVRRLLPETVVEELLERIQLSRIDSSAIAILLCGILCSLVGIVSVQMLVAGNILVAQLLGWVLGVGIVGLAILFYARAARA
jgi:hypothetical protein